MGSLTGQFFREGATKMKIVAVLLSLSVCHGYYIYHPQYPFIPSVPSGLWMLRGLPTAPIVIDLPSPNEFECPKDGTFPNLENACDSFYVCSNENVWEYTCDPGLKFDGSIGQCNWSDKIDDNCNWHEDAISIGKKQD